MKLNTLCSICRVLPFCKGIRFFLFFFLIAGTTSFAQTLSINDVSQAEGSGGGTTTFTFTVSINEGPQADPIQFEYSTADGTAEEPGDYLQASNLLEIIPAGDTSVEIDITVIADDDLEGNETFLVQLANPTDGISLADNTGTGTIQNDDSATLTITNQAVLEDAGSMVFTVTLDNAVQDGTAVNYSFTDGSATGGGVDFTGTAGTLTFAGTVNEQETITVPINDDAVVEGTESFTVILGTPTNGVGVSGSPATGTINDNDSAAITIADVTVTEGAGMLFTVT
ncbi:Calx-beta domain-containing protein, partial [Robiginitalea marina]